MSSAYLAVAFDALFFGGHAHCTELHRRFQGLSPINMFNRTSPKQIQALGGGTEIRGALVRPMVDEGLDQRRRARECGREAPPSQVRNPDLQVREATSTCWWDSDSPIDAGGEIK